MHQSSRRSTYIPEGVLKPNNCEYHCPNSGLLNSLFGKTVIEINMMQDGLHCTCYLLVMSARRHLVIMFVGKQHFRSPILP
jgi:hypothetical protein